MPCAGCQPRRSRSGCCCQTRSSGDVKCAGDTIGVLLNRAAETITFFKDGVDLGVAFDHVQEERLYPCVGMRTKDEEVSAFTYCSAGKQSRCNVTACTYIMLPILSRHRTHGSVYGRAEFSRWMQSVVLSWRPPLALLQRRCTQLWCS